MQLNGRWALVTGASSGLGREMARDLAYRHGSNVVLVARREERLKELQQELNARGVESDIIVADLSNRDDVERVFDAATTKRDIYAVVLNAGVTHFGEHRDLSWDAFESMLATNVTSTVRLTNHFVPYLVERNQGGGLMLVTSMTGLVPTPYQAAYSGTKAFLTTFGQALYHELARENVSLTTFAPGGILTEFGENNGLNDSFGNTIQMMPANDCARMGIDAMMTRRDLAIPGMFNQLQLMLGQIFPRKLVGTVVAQAYRRALTSRQS